MPSVPARRVFTILLAAASVSSAQNWRWIEAEDAVATNMSVKHGFAPNSDEERAKLSGGKWIGGPEKRATPLFAVYDVDVPADGTYHLYARKFWKHGPYRVRFKDQTVEIGEDPALLDNVELRQWVVANWTPAGEFKLNAGKQRFRIESTKDEGAIAFDCFLLTPDPFTPRGTLKPDQKLKSDTTGFFAWDPPADVPDSPIDLSWLNEKIAGSEGFVATQGDHFILPRSNKPVRFWGVNLGQDMARLPDSELDRFASMFASRGVNLVRLHGAFYQQSGPDVGRIDDAQLANIRRTVAAFKRRGIYSTLSIYFPLWVKLDARHGWPGYRDQVPFGLLFIDPKFQSLYRNWWRELLTRTDELNPVALKDEPAVLSLEILNEDSLFFWTFKPYEMIPAPTMEQFERRFASWLANKYGSANAAIDKWSAEKVQGDDPARGRVGIAEPWRWFNKRDGRSKDTVAFLFEMQRGFYQSTRDYLRNEIGAKSLISASNWTTASEEYLGPLERASYLPGDFIDSHGYFNGLHQGDRAGWLVSQNDKYTDRSALRFDPETPGGKPQSWNPVLGSTFNDLPRMISEIDWLEPNAYRGEGPLISAAYGSMQDVDAMAFFAAGTAGWQQTISKFALMSPVSLGEFPAASLLFRQGLIATTPTLVDGSIPLKNLLDLQGYSTGIDGKSKFIGTTRLRVDDNIATSRPTADLSPFIAGSKISNTTRQLALDSGIGLMKIDAPAAKGIVGFLSAAGDVSLDGLSIRSDMHFGSIIVVALDGKPIAESPKLLVQVMSQQQNNKWKTAGDPLKTITSYGTPPLVVKEFSGTITIRGERRWRAQRVGPNLAPIGDPTPIEKTLALDATTPYYMLTPQP